MNRASRVARASARWLLCLALAACGHALGAEGARDGATATHRLDAAGLRARGLAALRSGDGVRAEQYLVLAARAGAAEASVVAPLVAACVSSLRLQSALAHALPYLSRHPEAWRLRQLVAAIQLALGRSALARAELARVTRDHPRAAGAHYLSAVIARDQLADDGAAAAAFAAYLRADPRGEHAAEARSWLREHDHATVPTAEPNPPTGARP